MTNTTSSWVVLMVVEGKTEVFATADSRSEARKTVNWLKATGTAKADLMTWEEAERIGLVG